MTGPQMTGIARILHAYLQARFAEEGVRYHPDLNVDFYRDQLAMGVRGILGITVTDDGVLVRDSLEPRWGFFRDWLESYLASHPDLDGDASTN